MAFVLYHPLCVHHRPLRRAAGRPYKFRHCWTQHPRPTSTSTTALYTCCILTCCRYDVKPTAEDKKAEKLSAVKVYVASLSALAALHSLARDGHPVPPRLSVGPHACGDHGPAHRHIGVHYWAGDLGRFAIVRLEKGGWCHLVAVAGRFPQSCPLALFEAVSAAMLVPCQALQGPHQADCDLPLRGGLLEVSDRTVHGHTCSSAQTLPSSVRVGHAIGLTPPHFTSVLALRALNAWTLLCITVTGRTCT